MLHWGSGGIALPFLISELDAGEWSASVPGRFTSGEIATGTYCIGRWLSPREGLDAMLKRKACFCWE
jgi:hypothetical protein